jgi:hypothetical protein
VALPDTLDPQMRAIIEMMSATPLPPLASLAPPTARAQDAGQPPAPRTRRISTPSGTPRRLRWRP